MLRFLLVVVFLAAAISALPFPGYGGGGYGGGMGYQGNAYGGGMGPGMGGQFGAQPFGGMQDPSMMG